MVMKGGKKRRSEDHEKAKKGKFVKTDHEFDDKQNLTRTEKGQSEVHKFILAMNEMEKSPQEHPHKKRKDECGIELKQVEQTLENMETEDSEKAAVREKKRLKRQAKKEAKKKEQEAAEAARGTAPDLALKYLHRWHTDHDNWTFQKVRQVWLLQNLYDTEKISEENFQILLQYLAGLKGRGRQTTAEKAEKLLDAAETKKAENTKEATSETEDKSVHEGSLLTEQQYERVRQVIQILS